MSEDTRISYNSDSEGRLRRYADNSTKKKKKNDKLDCATPAVMLMLKTESERLSRCSVNAKRPRGEFRVSKMFVKNRAKVVSKFRETPVGAQQKLCQSIATQICAGVACILQAQLWCIILFSIGNLKVFNTSYLTLLNLT